jgi:uncharacterized RDD family membrane protein YckC
LYAVLRHEVGREVIRREKAAATRPGAGSTLSRKAPTTASVPADGATPALKARVDEAPLSEAPSTSPAQIGAAQTEPADESLDLVAYEGGRWRYVAPVAGLPEGFKADRIWLGASAEAVFMFWPVEGAGGEASALRCLCWRDGRWTVLPDVELGAPLGYGTVVYIEPRIGFVAGLRGMPRSSRPRATGPDARTSARDSAASDGSPSGDSVSDVAATWRGWSLVDDQWRAGEPFVFDAKRGGGPELAPGATAMGALGQNIFVATVRKASQIEVGIWPPEGGPAKRALEGTAVFELPRSPLLDPRTRDWLGLIIVLGVLVLVFWTRQESLSTPALLPRGLTLAAYWRRLVGILVDMLPAVVVTVGLWYGPWMAYLEELATAGAGWKDTMPPIPGRLLLSWLLIRVLYAVYSGLFEWKWGATPGKRLLGCRILSDAGRPPTPREILIRNAMRIVELEPYLPIWPLLLVMFFTRNRQRLGDLLAHTVVVEPGEPARPEVDDDPY